jgi:hypothetical protein
MPEEIFCVLEPDRDGGFDATRSFPTFESAEVKAKSMAKRDPGREVLIARVVATVVAPVGDTVTTINPLA